MIFDTNTPTSTLTIQGVALAVPQPFVEGHVVNANEAAALNQLVKENTANNFRAKVKSAIAAYAKAEAEAGNEVDAEADDFELPESEIAALQSDLDTYLTGYEFGVRQSRGERASRNPLDKKMASIANKMLRKSIIAAGKKPADFEDKWDAMLEAVLSAKNDVIKAEAERQLAVEREAADVSLAELLA